MSVTVRPMVFEEWALVRTIRLAALADTPDAFAATLADESAFSDERWQERARSNAEGIASICFLALIDDVACGLSVGVWSAPAVVLNALWVAPHARQQGAGRALVEAVIGWARSRGAAQVRLEVTETSSAAIALYRGLGFDRSAEEVSTPGRLPSFCMQRVP